MGRFGIQGLQQMIGLQGLVGFQGNQGRQGTQGKAFNMQQSNFTNTLSQSFTLNVDTQVEFNTVYIQNNINGCSLSNNNIYLSQPGFYRIDAYWFATGTGITTSAIYEMWLQTAYYTGGVTLQEFVRQEQNLEYSSQATPLLNAGLGCSYTFDFSQLSPSNTTYIQVWASISFTASTLAYPSAGCCYINLTRFSNSP